MRRKPQGLRRSVGRGTGGLGIEPRNTTTPGCRRPRRCGRQYRTGRERESRADPARSKTPSTSGNIPCENREIPWLPGGKGVRARRQREVQGRNPMMNGHGKSHSPIVPTKPPNKAGETAAEGVEGRGLAKGNSREQNALRTQGRVSAQSALERVRGSVRPEAGTV
jgi:hypothetical protein